MIRINGKILNNSASNFCYEKIFNDRKRESSINIEKVYVDTNIGNVNFFYYRFNRF